MEIRRTAPSADALKSAILAGIVAANEFLKLKENPGAQIPEGAEETAAITERLILQLEDALSGEAPDDNEAPDDT